ncbi:hypothetical protein BV25DRAFT_1818515 [Artomyces pyxidatus]|uniref:Uncharacterized protein n=1 Tax=Artomyces pyxidatus TaxID=48021 RepID=A0ACB8TI61_9AGAM|nr:hypothetical protein BV25DRAFT_1818515 [Artomyces pyxidatus]
MLPSSQSSFASQASFFPSLNSSYSDMAAAFAGPSNPAAQASLDARKFDPNSPELFKENIKVVQTHISHVQSLARVALDGIERAYHTQANPTQIADQIAALRQSLHTLSELLVSTGVGALPIIPPDVTQAPSEEELAKQATKAVQLLFNRHSEYQASANIVADIMSVSDQAARR